MNKKLFTLLVILMSLSLIGIIFIQAYFINSSLETKEDQFTFNVKKALRYTTTQIADNEYKKYVKALNKIISEGIDPDTTAIRNITIYKQDNLNNQIIINPFSNIENILRPTSWDWKFCGELVFFYIPTSIYSKNDFK